MQPKHEWLWIDLETSGLDPNENKVLEWAVVLAADDVAGDMSPVEQFSGVVHYAWLPQMDDFVRNMHTKNGLLEEVVHSTTTLEESDDFLASLCERLGAEPRRVKLAGASVDFDRKFVHAHMPNFAKFLSHQVVDVSSLKAVELAWGGSPIPRAATHRALPDILATLAEAAEFRRRRYTLGGA